MGRERNAKGQFLPGNEIGSETRVKKGEILRTVYDDSYADDILDYFINHEGYPTVQGWCAEKNIFYKTAVNWGQNSELCPRFVTAYAQCMAIQQAKGIEGGMSGRFNPRFAKFMLSACHGMSEKTEQKIEADATASFTVEIKEVN